MTENLAGQRVEEIPSIPGWMIIYEGDGTGYIEDATGNAVVTFDEESGEFYDLRRGRHRALDLGGEKDYFATLFEQLSWDRWVSVADRRVERRGDVASSPVSYGSRAARSRPESVAAASASEAQVAPEVARVEPEVASDAARGAQEADVASEATDVEPVESADAGETGVEAGSSEPEVAVSEQEVVADAAASGEASGEQAGRVACDETDSSKKADEGVRYVRMTVPRGFAHHYIKIAKDGRELQKAVVGIPSGTKANGVSLDGYSFDIFVNDFQLSQIVNGEPLSVSMREGKKVELFRGKGDERKVLMIDPWVLTSAMKKSREDYAAAKAARGAQEAGGEQ